MLPTLSAFTFAVSTSTETKVEFWAATGLIVGIVLFIRGLVLRFKRLIMNAVLQDSKRVATQARSHGTT